MAHFLKKYEAGKLQLPHDKDDCNFDSYCEFNRNTLVLQCSFDSFVIGGMKQVGLSSLTRDLDTCHFAIQSDYYRKCLKLFFIRIGFSLLVILYLKQLVTLKCVTLGLKMNLYCAKYNAKQHII